MKVDDLRFSNHLILRLKERNLKTDWIIDVVQHPDEEINITEDETHFYKKMTESQDKWLKVVVNKKNKIIVTAYFDRNKKGNII
jgi:hypothetical protein